MPRRQSFRCQIDSQRGGAHRRPSLLMPETDDEREELAVEIHDAAAGVTSAFESKFVPSDMRQLALVAHNHMKPAMKEFITTYSEVLKKFRITGTQTTMRMCKTLWGEDNPEIEYGLTCTSGPLGGDAQIAALMCMEDLGALIFFTDPLSAHPHQADIDSLIRLSNCGNVIFCNNPTSAMSMMHTLKMALENGSRGMIPSFFETLESPAVAEYKRQQEMALAKAVGATAPTAPVRGVLGTDPSMYFHMDSHLDEEKKDADDDTDDDSDDDFLNNLYDSPEEVIKACAYRYSGNENVNDSALLKRNQSVTNLYGVEHKRKPRKTWRNLGKVLKKRLSM